MDKKECPPFFRRCNNNFGILGPQTIIVASRLAASTAIMHALRHGLEDAGAATVIYETPF
jgi:hypothetical protein